MEADITETTKHDELRRHTLRIAGRRPDLRIVAALLMLPLLVLLPAALLRGVFYIHDIQYYFYPYHIAVTELLRGGQPPLWNPYAFGGIPLLGDGQTALFYPPNWLFILLPGGAALNYDILLQFGIAGAGMYLCARGLGLERLPALIGALAYMFCGFMTARVVHLSIQSGVALIPLVFFCVEKTFRSNDGRWTMDDGRWTRVQDRRWKIEDRTSSSSILHSLSSIFNGRWSLALGRSRWFVASAGAVGLQALTGHPQMPVYTALALGLYALVRAVERWRAVGDWRSFYGLPLQPKAPRSKHSDATPERARKRNLIPIILSHAALLAGIYTLGYGLAAIQLAPWVELGAASPRSAGASFDFVFGNSTAGGDWLLLLFPYLYGSLRPGPYASQALDIGSMVRTWEHSAYVGILPLALAAYALLGLLQRSHVRTFARSHVRTTTNDESLPNVPTFQRSNVPTCFFGLLLTLALLFAAGKHTPLANLIYHTPVIGKLRDVERVMALADFALAALAALGMQRLVAPHPPAPSPTREEGEQAGVWRPSLLVIAAITALLPTGVVFLARRASFQQAMQLPPQAIANLQAGRLNVAVPLALALLSAALLLWWSRRPATPVTQALAAGLVLLDLGSYAALFNPLADPRLYERRPDVLAAFQADSAPFRKATFLPDNDLDNHAAQETLAVSWGMAYGVEDVNGFNSLQPRRYTDYLFGPQVGDVSYGELRDERLLQPESPILSALNVRYILVPSNLHPRLGSQLRQVYENTEVRVYENTLAYPRAFFAETVRGETDPRAVLSAVTANGFDGRRLALVETSDPPVLPPASGPADVRIVKRGANRMELATSTAAPRLLVLSEMYFPGWRAFVDGAETPIFRTNYLFRGVVVPAGQHTVTVTYRPASALLGAAISAVALAVTALLRVWPTQRAG